MEQRQHCKNKKAGFLLVEIVLATALLVMAILTVGRLMMLQQKRMHHTRVLLTMQEMLEREKAKVLAGKDAEETAPTPAEFQIQKEESRGADEMGISGLRSRKVVIQVQHKKTGWTQEITVITIDPRSIP